MVKRLQLLTTSLLHARGVYIDVTLHFDSNRFGEWINVKVIIIPL